VVEGKDCFQFQFALKSTIMENIKNKRQFVVCVKNDGYQASLEPRKIYQLLPDSQAEDHHLIRVIDEEGEDYLYPEDFFIPITLTNTIAEALALGV